MAVEKELYTQFRNHFPILCTDGVVVSEEKVLLVMRNIEPFKGYWTLPGGHVDFGETIEGAVCREVKEETGLTAKVDSLIGIFSDPSRDPWGHVVSIAYLLTPESNISKKSISADLKEVTDVQWFPLNKLPKMGFDHKSMVESTMIS